MSQSPILICRTDGASRGNPGPAAAGAAVFDENGRERRAISLYLGQTTNNVAEYLALAEGLKAAAEVCREDGVTPAQVAIVVKTDSQLMARQISGDYKIKSPDLIPLYRDFQALAQGFLRVKVDYVPRKENKRADELANQALDEVLKGPGETAATAAMPAASPKAAVAPVSRARPARYSRLSHLECSRCGREHDAARLLGSCPDCGGPLLAVYDLQGLTWPPAGPATGSAARAGDPASNSMWRYHELLPVTDPGSVVSLGEGLTPLVALPGYQRLFEPGTGVTQVLVKDDRLNPTGTFKSRGASASVSRLAELGAERCAIPTAGNAGAAFAAYCSRAGISFLTAMPEDTPAAIRSECQIYGAEVVTVAGLLPDAARYVRERAETEGWYVASTFDEPYRAEGKKTIALELFEAFGSKWPDAIVFPVGGGVALIAAWKAIRELAEAGVGPAWGAGNHRGGAGIPRLFAVQAEGCAPIVRAFDAGQDETEPVSGARTLAAGLRVPSPKAGFLALRAIRETGGGAVAASDEAILQASAELRRQEGLNFSPEGAAAVAALPELARRGWLDGCRSVVIVNTGSGLKYPV